MLVQSLEHEQLGIVAWVDCILITCVVPRPAHLILVVIHYCRIDVGVGSVDDLRVDLFDLTVALLRLTDCLAGLMS